MIHVIKASGLKEPFSEEKVMYSIHRAGIPDAIQHEVLSHVKEKLYDNIPTSEVYHHITEYLDQTSQQHIRAKYGLKQAIMALGPTGYPFEDFVAEVLKTQGYNVEVRQMLQGACVMHETDVVAQKDGKKIMVEAKFHNAPGIRTDVHVALYTKARFEDVKQKHHIDEAWIVTNTKTTVDALNFGDCVGMKVISWNLPEGESLRDMIEHAKLSPITTLTSISQGHKEKLLENHIVLCKQIVQNPHCLSVLDISEQEKNATILEAEYVAKT